MPRDPHDDRLLAHVRPDGWTNPSPRALYDLVVIGGGTAGLVCAAGAAGLGARVALVERDRLGGDCLNTGCVPSKALLRSAQAAAGARNAAPLGVEALPRVDFGAVMERLRARRADLAPHDSAARLTALGVDVFFGEARFSGPRTVAVGGRALSFRKAAIATGSRPSVPPIAGLDRVPYFTTDSIFSLTDRPRDLLVLGGGPAGCELAQAFARLGSRVTLIESAPRLLPRDDPDASALVAASLARDGVELRLGARAAAVEPAPGGVAVSGAGERITAAVLLVVTGRSPNVEGLGLEAAGVRHDAHGVAVDDRLRTSNRRVYASGDVCSRFKFTHAADALSRIVVQNALFFGRARASVLVIPWCTFTEPAVAHVGTGGDAAITVPLRDVDRAVVDDEAEGFVRIHHRGGRITGATVVGPAAGELIGTIAYAIRGRGTLGDLSATIFPYPTLSTALRQAGDAHRRTRLTPLVRQALAYYFGTR